MSSAANYGRALRAMRAWRGISGTRLARLAGYAQGSISLWERGVHRPGLPVRKNVCAALRFPLEVMENLARGESALERAATNLTDFNEPGELFDRFELSRRSGVGARVIQDYVNGGLLSPIRDGRYRWYTHEHVEKARTLKATRMQRQIANYRETMRQKRECHTS